MSLGPGVIPIFQFFSSWTKLFSLWVPSAKIVGQSESCFQTTGRPRLSQMSDDECDCSRGSYVQRESHSDRGADKQKLADESFAGSSSSWDSGLESQQFHPASPISSV